MNVRIAGQIDAVVLSKVSMGWSAKNKIWSELRKALLYIKWQ
jgi:hypothetical protein